MGQLIRDVKQVNAQLQAELQNHSELHDAVVVLRMRQRTLMGQIQRAHEVSEEALSAALADYLDKLQYERPTNAGMLAFRAQVLLPLNEQTELTACSDWDNRVAARETWERVLQVKGGGFPAETSATNSLGRKFVLIPPASF